MIAFAQAGFARRSQSAGGDGNPFRVPILFCGASARADADELIERARGEPGQVQSHEGEPELATQFHDGLAQLQGARHGVGFDLDPRDLVVKAHSQLPEAQGAQTLFKGVYLMQALGGNRGAVGEA